eukprot:2515593-Alexandrium_andersonii.AAC.1
MPATMPCLAALACLGGPCPFSLPMRFRASLKGRAGDGARAIGSRGLSSVLTSSLLRAMEASLRRFEAILGLSSPRSVPSC